MSHPGRPDELHLIDTIVPADEIRHVSGEIWPELEPLLGRQSPGLAAAAGAGYDHPFGQDHPKDRTRAAREAGEMLARALAGRDDLSAGLLVRLRSAVKRFNTGVTVRLPPDLEVFFSDIEASGGNWLEAEQALASVIRSAADARAGDDPDDVIALLAEVKAELAYLPPLPAEPPRHSRSTAGGSSRRSAALAARLHSPGLPAGRLCKTTRTQACRTNAGT